MGLETYFMAKHGTKLQRFRVPLGFLFAAVFLIFAIPTPLTLIIGAIISVIGLLILGVGGRAYS